MQVKRYYFTLTMSNNVKIMSNVKSNPFLYEILLYCWTKWLRVTRKNGTGKTKVLCAEHVENLVNCPWKIFWHIIIINVILYFLTAVMNSLNHNDTKCEQDTWIPPDVSITDRVVGMCQVKLWPLRWVLLHWLSISQWFWGARPLRSPDNSVLTSQSK